MDNIHVNNKKQSIISTYSFRNQDFKGQTCTHTRRQTNPWWSVDLGAEYNIGRVRIYNRRDCCGK